MINKFFLPALDLLEVVANVKLNLCHQRRDGDERAAQRVGVQDAFQPFQLFRGWVNFGVLRRGHRVLQLSPHVRGFGAAAADFRAQRVLPRRLVAPFVAVGMQRQRLSERRFVLRAQLGQRQDWHHFNGDAESLDHWIRGNRLVDFARVLRVPVGAVGGSA